jgi:hypothetical protein
MRTSFRHQSEAQPPNGPLTAATSPDTPSTCPATQSGLFGAFIPFMGLGVSSRSSVPNICTRQTNSLASVSKASPEAARSAAARKRAAI